MVMFPGYLNRSHTHGHQTAPWWWVNMNALTVISVATLVASGSASLLAYNGVYGGHHGLLGAYPYAGYSGVVPYAYAGGLPAAASLTIKTPVIKTLAPTPISYNVAPAPVSYNVAPVAVSYNVAPSSVSYNVAPVAPVQSQYHAQDEIGQYSFGYAAVHLHALSLAMPSVLSVGSYNYVDSEGKVQTQHYVADALGFRAPTTKRPPPRPYSFGYAGGPSSRAESRDAFGVVRGSYNYVDSEGKVQTQHYVADALGFRASGTNLPMAPDAPLAALPGPVPEPVQDTAEVVAAKLAHFQAYNEAAAAAAAAPDTR
nr:uncharacterized protein LOC113827066 [Penaeus vannamei]